MAGMERLSDKTAVGVMTPGMPLYKGVKRQIMDALHRGDWKPGAAIPSEKMLGERFGVSIGTVRKAVDELTAENLLIRQQGRGTYVASHNRNRQFFYFFHIVRREDGAKEYPQVELIRFGRGKADPQEALRLNIDRGAGVFRFTNRLSIGGEPVIVDDITLPERIFSGLTERSLRQRPSTLYHFYQQAYGVSVVRTEDRLHAVAASGFQAEVLALEPGAPLLQVERTALSYHDRPVEYRRSCVDTRNYEYFRDVAGEA